MFEQGRISGRMVIVTSFVLFCFVLLYPGEFNVEEELVRLPRRAERVILRHFMNVLNITKPFKCLNQHDAVKDILANSKCICLNSLHIFISKPEGQNPKKHYRKQY